MVTFYHAAIESQDVFDIEDSGGILVGAYFVDVAKAEAWIAVEQAKIHPVADEWGRIEFHGDDLTPVVIPSDTESEWYDATTKTLYEARIYKIDTED